MNWIPTILLKMENGKWNLRRPHLPFIMMGELNEIIKINWDSL